MTPSVDLPRTAAERLHQIGEVQEANRVRQRTLVRLEAGGKVDLIDHAATLVQQARALVQQGQPDAALKALEQARDRLPEGRERAIVLGDIVRILTDKGQVDEALAMHREMVRIFESRGDTRSRAVTLGDIAHIRLQQGKPAEAL